VLTRVSASAFPMNGNGIAAQGTTKRIYPGATIGCKPVPLSIQGRTMRGPDSVDAHSNGSQPAGNNGYGGNVWQWTDEYVMITPGGILRWGKFTISLRDPLVFPQANRTITRQAVADGAEL